MRDKVMKNFMTWQHPICHPWKSDYLLHNPVKHISPNVHPHELRRILFFPTPLAPLLSLHFFLCSEENHHQITAHSRLCPSPCPLEDYTQCFKQTKRDLVCKVLGKYHSVTSLRCCQLENKGFKYFQSPLMCITKCIYDTVPKKHASVCVCVCVWRSNTGWSKSRLTVVCIESNIIISKQ